MGIMVYSLFWGNAGFISSTVAAVSLLSGPAAPLSTLNAEPGAARKSGRRDSEPGV